MKAFLFGLILVTLFGELVAQEPDSLRKRSTYEKAWLTAMADEKISQDERLLLDILVESLILSLDSTITWENVWEAKYEMLTKTSTTEAELDQSGRWPLVLQNIVIGSSLYGWAVPYVLHADNFRWYTGGVMISAGSAFYLTYKYTKNREMTHARTQMMRYGSLLGFRYGLGINQLLDLYDDPESEQRETLWAWVLMTSVPAGHYGGEFLFEEVDPSNGQAWAWTMWTGIAGLTARLAHNVMDERPVEPEGYGFLYDDSHWEQYNQDKEAWDKRKTITELIAYPAGIWAGYKLVRNKQYSFGDALMLLQGWGFGFNNTMMLQSILSEEFESDTFFFINALGAIGSTCAYDRWIRNDDFSFGQSTLMLLGSASGTAFGFGTAILLNVQEEKPMLTMALLGYGTGTWLTRKILDVKSDGALTHASSTRISLSPTSLAVSGPDHKAGLIPALSVHISFR